MVFVKKFGSLIVLYQPFGASLKDFTTKYRDNFFSPIFGCVAKFRKMRRFELSMVSKQVSNPNILNQNDPNLEFCNKTLSF